MDSSDFALGYAMADNNGNNCNSNNGGWGDGNGWWVLIILFALFGGWGRGGFGGGYGAGGGDCSCGGGGVTRADMCSEFNFNNLDNAVRGVQQGICSLGYDQLAQINGVNANIAAGFAGVNNAICTLGYQNADLIHGTNVAMMQGFNGVQTGQTALGTQLAQCCCDTQRQIERGFCDVNYNMATNTTAIMQNAHNDTDRVIAKLDQMEATRQQEKIEALRLENQTLKFQASQAAQNTFITANQDAQTAEILRRTGHECPSAAYIVQPPMPVSFPTNSCGVFNGWGNNGCGCNSGCGGCC